MITPKIKTKILKIINVFETGKPEGKYDSVVRYKDGPNRIRQITYGRSQTTEYGNLKRLLEKYVSMNGTYSSSFKPYIDKVGKNALTDDKEFIRLLKISAREDAVMCKCQDDFFDLYYYEPAYNWFNGFGFKDPLSLLVIYDSFIHSGSILNFLRQRFAERPPSKGGNGHKWIEEYVKVRHDWLANHSNKILNNTVYRTKCFKEQIKNNNWSLSKPVVANGVTVD